MGKIYSRGLVAVVAGLIIQFAPQAFSWFGKLPGDIRYEKGNFKFFSAHHRDSFECWSQSASEIIRKIISVAKVDFLRQEKYG